MTDLPTLAVVVALALVAAGCAARAAATAGPAAPRIDAERARSLLADGGVLVDVRSSAEFDMGHIAGATNIPVGQMRRRAEELPADRPVIVYCLSGHRSARAARTLTGTGRTEVYDLGSLRNWDD